MKVKFSLHLKQNSKQYIKRSVLYIKSDKGGEIHYSKLH